MAIRTFTEHVILDSCISPLIYDIMGASEAMHCFIVMQLQTCQLTVQPRGITDHNHEGWLGMLPSCARCAVVAICLAYLSIDKSVKLFGGQQSRGV